MKNKEQLLYLAKKLCLNFPNQGREGKSNPNTLTNQSSEKE